MNIFEKAMSGLGSMIAKSIGYDVPTISGGTDIFRSFLTGDAWNTTKRLDTYKKSLYVFACVYKIAQKVASIDWEMYKIINLDGDKEEVMSHEAIDLLYRPNPYQTKEEFFQRYMINKKLAGDAFILKVRAAGPGTKVKELWNLRPDYMRVVFDTKGNILGYEFTGAAKTIVFAPEDIIHDSYPDPMSEFGGMSPLQPATIRVDVEEFATKYQRNFFINNARPDFILSSDRKVTNEQKEEIKSAWEKRHQGSKNSGKGAFLEGGLEYQQVSISQTDMDYIEGLKATRDDILTAFGVPKPIVSITDDVNLANAETAMEIFMTETVVPEIRALTNKLNEHLIYEEFDVLFYLEFENPVPDDERTRAEIQQLRITSGTMLINEAREQWGEEPIKGGWNLYLPFGVTPSGGLPDPSNTAKQMGGDTPEEAYVARRKRYGSRKASKAKVFRGRAQAYKVLEKKAEIRHLVVKTLVSTIKDEGMDDDTPKKPSMRPMIKAEVRDAYGDLTIKQIDQRSDHFKEELDAFFKGQKARLIKKLKLADKDVKAGKVEGKLQAWAEKEVTLGTEFSLPFIAEYVKQAGEAAMELVAPAETFDDKSKRIQAYVNKRAKAFGKQTTNTTYDKVAATLGEGIANDEAVSALVDRIDSVYSDFPLYRSEMIARTEATSANNKGFIESYTQSGVANAKEWIATGDDRTRDSHIMVDGDIVGLEDKFDNGLEFPGDPNADASETVNCRCVIGPAFSE